MADREKLVELLDEVQRYGTATNPSLNCAYNGDIADHLLANGVIVLPCKVGDTVYFQDDYYGRAIQEAEIKCLRFRADKNKVLFGADVEFHIVDPYYTDGRLMLCGAIVGINNNFGNQPTAFLTREEAEAALKEGRE